MIWVSRLLIFILGVIVSVLLAPILPLFAVMREGKSGNGAYILTEPRLPKWLSLFDNPDNSLWGDSGWRKEHCSKWWGCYLGMVLWLLRNKGGNIKYDLLAIRPPEIVTWEGTVGIDSSPYNSGKLMCWSGEYWQWKYVSKPIGKRCILLSFGWMLDYFIPREGYIPDYNEKAKFLFQVQFSTIKL